ncbi:MAG: hypothetical protein RIC56_03315 [Pseudomonadales bacterium]
MHDVDLRLVFPIGSPNRPGSRWLLGAVILAALLGFFWVCEVFAPETAPTQERPFGPALFFSVIIAYIVPIFGYIGERTEGALEALRGELDADDAQVNAWRDRIHLKPMRWLVIVLLIGIGLGIAHNALLFVTLDDLDLGRLGSPEIALIFGTELTWVVVTIVVAGLLDNAKVLHRAARHCVVPLLDTRRLRPFATVAVISTLAVIGAQAAFPIMNVGGSSDAVAFIPGLIATGVPMILLAAMPIWPVRQRISAAKARALEAVNRQLMALPAADPARPETLAALAPLLAYRREVQQISDWPFDLGVVARLCLYLIIPPLTWVGAALIENLVDTFL